MNASLRACAIALCVALSGCAARPVVVECRFPPLPAELDRDPPPPGWFSLELGRILDRSYSTSPAEPTN